VTDVVTVEQVIDAGGAGGQRRQQQNAIGQAFGAGNGNFTSNLVDGL
jgi:hypothetical protein